MIRGETFSFYFSYWRNMQKVRKRRWRGELEISLFLLSSLLILSGLFFILSCRLATKLLKLSSDSKRTWKEGEAEDTEERLHETLGKLNKLENQNANLKGKISILKQQLASSWRRSTPYGHVTSKTDSVFNK